jgi:hypothetical protein
LSHKDAVDFFRSNLVTFSPSDFHYYLPRVLLELLQTHTNDPYENEGAEAVLGLLDIEPSQAHTEWEAAQFGVNAATYAADARKRLAEMRRERIEMFTSTQAEAVAAFLMEAAKWRDFDNMRDVLANAQSYWNEKAAQSNDEN